MAEIFSIEAERDKRRSSQVDQLMPRGEWLMSVDVYAPSGGYSAVLVPGDAQCASGVVTGFSDAPELTAGERLRLWARALEDLSYILLDQAQAVEPCEDGQVLAVAKVWESSRVQTWTSRGVATPAQCEWLRHRFVDAGRTIKPLLP